jgi:hypothetical protein
MTEFNGYDFDDPKARKRMRYVIVFDGDMDLNGAYGCRSKKEVREYLKDACWKKPMAIFHIADMTRDFLP